MRTVAWISIAVVLTLLALSDIPEGVRSWQPWTFIVTVLALAALALRTRTRPFGAVVALTGTLLVSLGAEALDEPGQIPFGLVIVLGLLIADVAHASTTPVVVAVAALAVPTAVAAEGLADDRTTSDVAFVLLTWGFAIAVALAVRWRRQANAARDERVRILERERIARDLHDSVAHHVSAISLTAEGARGLVGVDDALVRSSLGSIHTASAATLDEMRKMVAILRDGGETDAPFRLDQLADSLRGGALPVDIVIEPTLAPPPDTVSIAAGRIAREAVTNAQRHATGATRVRVMIGAGDRELVVSVRDDGTATPPPRRRNGHGLTGMRERAELLGGSFRAGPSDTGGWAVEARLPIDGTR